MPRALTIKLEIFQVLLPSKSEFWTYHVNICVPRDKQTNRSEPKMPEKDILEFRFVSFRTDLYRNYCYGTLRRNMKSRDARKQKGGVHT